MSIEHRAYLIQLLPLSLLHIIMKFNIIQTDYPTTGVILFGFCLNLVRFYGEIYSIFMQTEHTLFVYYGQSANYKCTQWHMPHHSSFEFPIEMKLACSYVCSNFTSTMMINNLAIHPMHSFSSNDFQSIKSSFKTLSELNAKIKSKNEWKNWCLFHEIHVYFSHLFDKWKNQRVFGNRTRILTSVQHTRLNKILKRINWHLVGVLRD